MKKKPRYSPTKVTRQILNGIKWETIEEYEDATVRDQGENNFFRIPEAMLRAYPSTPELMEAWDKHNEWFVVEREDHIKHYGKDMAGYILDCDGDIALNRIRGYVLNKHSFGHASEEWMVLVGKDYDDGEEKGEWNGWGDQKELRIERWYVSLFGN